MFYFFTLSRFKQLTLAIIVSALICSCEDSAYRTDLSSRSSGSSSGELPTSPYATTQCDANEFSKVSQVSIESLALPADISSPVGIVFHPSNNDIAYILEQGGKIWRAGLSDDAGSDDTETKVLLNLEDYYNVTFDDEIADLCPECGLKGMAFHPDFESNGYFYLIFDEGYQNSDPIESVIARFTSDDNGSSVTLASDDTPERQEIYRVTQPQTAHNSAQIHFGPDGYLYASFGDGVWNGSEDNAQDLKSPLGSFLRLTDEGDPAPGNAVVGGLPEMYAVGLRNSWSWSFDRETGEIWAGDVGNSRVEEINIIENGRNYGWPCYEGLLTYGSFESCDSLTQWQEPVITYPRSEGRSVTGGYVYRGTQIPELYGSYLFGDFESGIIWKLQKDGETSTKVKVFTTGKKISAFGEDNSGEIYFSDYVSGDIYKLKPLSDDQELPTVPQNLSDTGCVNRDNPRTPANHLTAYSINEPFWSDNALKERYFSLPVNTKIRIASNGRLIFPPGSILMKSFTLNDKLIETRLLLNHRNAGWTGYSYEWNEQGTDAHLVEEATQVELENQAWHYPSTAECAQCHTPAAGYVLGLETLQLNKYVQSDNGQTRHQLELFYEKGLLDQAPSAGQMAASLKTSTNEQHPLEQRARSYLHSNCSQCHRRAGTTEAQIDLRYEADYASMKICNMRPTQKNFDIENARIVNPGNPAGSVLLHRMKIDGDGQMPPIGRLVQDDHGQDLTEQWINSLEICQGPYGEVKGEIYIKNIGSSLYLNAGDDQVGQQDLLTDLVLTPLQTAESQWELVNERDNIFRLKNAGHSDLFLNILDGYPETTEIENHWWAPLWHIEKHGDNHTIRNLWQPENYLYVDSTQNTLRYGPVDPYETEHHIEWSIGPQ